MSGSYKGVFIFTIVMTIFVFFMGAISGSKGQIGTLIWGYTAWLMYKRKNSQLVGLYKFLLWFVGFAAILMFFLFISYGETLGYSGTGLFFLFLLVFIVDYSLLKFFQGEVQRELSPSAIVHMKSTDGTMPNLTNEQIWEKASLELEGKRREGLWARCFAQSNGDENRARALYLRNRVSEIESELNIKPTSKNFAINIPLLNEAKEWWDTLNFVGKICVIGLIIALLAHYFGWIDG
jgi:Ca2+/Na+ antiporter